MVPLTASAPGKAHSSGPSAHLFLLGPQGSFQVGKAHGALWGPLGWGELPGALDISPPGPADRIHPELPTPNARTQPGSPSQPHLPVSHAHTFTHTHALGLLCTLCHAHIFTHWVSQAFTGSHAIPHKCYSLENWQMGGKFQRCQGNYTPGAAPAPLEVFQRSPDPAQPASAPPTPPQAGVPQLSSAPYHHHHAWADGPTRSRASGPCPSRRSGGIPGLPGLR